jgi:hypothetical protein
MRTGHALASEDSGSRLTREGFGVIADLALSAINRERRGREPAAAPVCGTLEKPPATDILFPYLFV